jgi:hypothetical protein
MSKTEKQIRREIKRIYDVFLKNKVKQWKELWKDGEYFCDIADVYLTVDYIIFYFKDINVPLYLSYDGKIVIRDNYITALSYHKVFPYTYTVSELRKLLKSLRKFILQMI